MIQIGRLEKPVACVFVMLLWMLCSQVPGVESADPQYRLAQDIPPRGPQAMTGSAFARFVAGMNERQRERAIMDQLHQGNIPGFLRKLKPVRLTCRAAGGPAVAATIFVMPDYLAIGSDRDFLRIPMSLYAAATTASRFGFILPTRKMVDAIFTQSDHQLRPTPMHPGPEMRSTAYYLSHNLNIDSQRARWGIVNGQLISGHKKDVVLTNRLSCDPKRVAIYGWHRGEGAPIQPLSTVHGAAYADYSHGTRLVSDQALVNGRRRSVYDVLKDPLLATVFSDEGCIPEADRILRPVLPPFLALKPVYARN